MTIYISGLLFTLLFASISENLAKSRKYRMGRQVRLSRILSKTFFLLAVIPLTYISAVRYRVGTDFYAYISIYATQAEDYKTQEPLFWSFIQLLRKISLNPQIFFVVSSIIVCVAYYTAIYQQSQNKVFSILLFVITQEYFRSMNVIRQYLGLSVLLLSISEIKSRNWKKVIPLVVIAFFLHNSTIVFFFIYMLYLLRIKPIFLCTGAAVAAAIAFTSNNFLQIFVKALSQFTNFARYFFSNSGFSEGSFTKIYFAIYFSYFLFLIYLYYIEKAEFNDDLKLLLYGVFTSTVFSAISSIFPSNIYRMLWYADPFIVLYTPSMLNAVGNKKIAFLLKFFIAAACYDLFV